MGCLNKCAEVTAWPQASRSTKVGQALVWREARLGRAPREAGEAVGVPDEAEQEGAW